MDTENILHDFYDAFAKGDTDRMLSHYHTDVIFEDPAFGKLNGKEARSMWSMLINKAKGDLNIEHTIIENKGNTGKVYWQARYHYGKSRRKVHNKITAEIRIEDGKIIRHTDHFNIWNWSRQALGISGLLLGWTPFMQGIIQNNAKQALKKYMMNQ